MKKHAGQKYLSAKQAAVRLGVDIGTVKRWARTGRLKAIAKTKTILLTHYLVAASSLKEAFEVRCRWCGKVFQTRFPMRTKFCRSKHRDAWHVRRRHLRRCR